MGGYVSNGDSGLLEFLVPFWEIGGKGDRCRRFRVAPAAVEPVLFCKRGSFFYRISTHKDYY